MGVPAHLDEQLRLHAPRRLVLALLPPRHHECIDLIQEDGRGGVVLRQLKQHLGSGGRGGKHAGGRCGSVGAGVGGVGAARTTRGGGVGVAPGGWWRGLRCWASSC